ncbi:hypothetical protein ACLB2K_006250 [Fragaria x ananassa]
MLAHLRVCKAAASLDPFSDLESDPDDGWWMSGWYGGYALVVSGWNGGVLPVVGGRLRRSVADGDGSEAVPVQRSGRIGTAYEFIDWAQWTRREVDLGRLKLNLDGAYREDESGGAGMLVRDEKGIVKGAWSMHLTNLNSPLQAEAMACREGLKRAVEQCWLDTDVESDCEVLVAALNGENGDYLEVSLDY